MFLMMVELVDENLESAQLFALFLSKAASFS
jgi:hypothetical protein